MAHDFIPLKEGDNLEKVGREIFDELTWRSFFQDVKRIPRREWRGELRPRTICKIHDLMHDIALSVMGKDCLTIVDRPNEKELLSTGPTRYLFSSYEYIGTLLDDYLKKHSPALRHCCIQIPIPVAQYQTYRSTIICEHCNSFN